MSQLIGRQVTTMRLLKDSAITMPAEHEQPESEKDRQNNRNS
jgi:hypothetical protein